MGGWTPDPGFQLQKPCLAALMWLPSASLKACHAGSMEVSLRGPRYHADYFMSSRSSVLSEQRHQKIHVTGQCSASRVRSKEKLTTLCGRLLSDQTIQHLVHGKMDFCAQRRETPKEHTILRRNVVLSAFGQKTS